MISNFSFVFLESSEKVFAMKKGSKARFEVENILYNKYNMQFYFGNVNAYDIVHLYEKLAKRCQRGFLINVAQFPSRERKGDLCLNVSFQDDTQFDTFIDALDGHDLFHPVRRADKALRAIFRLDYEDYCATCPSGQSIHVSEITPSGVTSGWNPHKEPVGTVVLYGPRLKDHRESFVRYWSVAVKSDTCVSYPFKGNTVKSKVDLVPSYEAELRSCRLIKKTLDEHTPFNTNWLVTYKDSAHCLVKCRDAEEADRIIQIMNAINDVPGYIAGDEPGLAMIVPSNIKIERIEPKKDDDSITIIVHDSLSLSSILVRSAPLQCFHCEKIEKKMSRCPCNKAFYCNQECQRADWLEHKKVCTYVKPK